MQSYFIHIMSFSHNFPSHIYGSFVCPLVNHSQFRSSARRRSRKCAVATCTNVLLFTIRRVNIFLPFRLCCVGRYIDLLAFWLNDTFKMFSATRLFLAHSHFHHPRARAPSCQLTRSTRGLWRSCRIFFFCVCAASALRGALIEAIMYATLYMPNNICAH